MTFLVYTAVVLFTLTLVSLVMFLYKPQMRRLFIDRNLPVLGWIPKILANTHRIHDFVTSILIRNGGTFRFNGPRLFNMDMLVTADPSNINHILSMNFPNFPKGQEFQQIFNILGDGIFTSDGKLWEIHRKITMSIFKTASFKGLLETITLSKLEMGLLPVLEFASNRDMEVDLQHIFQRFTFDTICELILDYDPQSLSLDFPYIPIVKALSDAEEAVLHRYITPSSLWKLQRILRIGKEKKMLQAEKTFDDFIYTCLDQNDRHPANSGLLAPIKRAFEGQSGTSGDPRKFLKDTLVTLMAAGKDTTSTALSWLFYLLAKNPQVEDRISEEIRTHLGATKTGDNCKHFEAKELVKLVYLQGALMEALRLFPPVPYNQKTTLQPDILPSGHHVGKKTKIILCFYSMGRMKSIWGNDCNEFKPERWFSDGGRLKHEPSYKFTAFNAGPRACLGKDMSLYQLKMVATTIIQRYRIQLVEGQSVVPSCSMVLEMKYGLKVTLTRRNEMDS